jgi:UDP-3-O-[3-hydroxymyristoyl] N-acetylglucosamine deacetylase
VIANRAGHAMHTALVSRLLKDPTLWEETTEDHMPVVVPVSQPVAPPMV